MQVVGVRKDKTLFPHGISVSTFQIDDEPIFTAIIRDITARKEDEEKIRRQNEELILLNTITNIIGQKHTKKGGKGKIFNSSNSSKLLFYGCCIV